LVQPATVTPATLLVGTPHVTQIGSQTVFLLLLLLEYMCKCSCLSNRSYETTTTTPSSLSIDGRTTAMFSAKLGGIEKRELLLQWAVGDDQVRVTPSGAKCTADALPIDDMWCYSVRFFFFVVCAHVWS
jgi:hypothetical protein